MHRLVVVSAFIYATNKEKDHARGLLVVNAVYLKQLILSLSLSLLNRVENPPSKKRNTVILMLNISEVKSKFYLYPFTCVARNKYGINAAYIQLIHPGKQ